MAGWTPWTPLTAAPDGARHAVLAELAKTGPLHRLVLPTPESAWVITSHTEARAAPAGLRPVTGGPRNSPFADELEESRHVIVSLLAANREPSPLLNKLTTLPVRIA